jgi:hypothetical protein
VRRAPTRSIPPDLARGGEDCISVVPPLSPIGLAAGAKAPDAPYD